MEIFKAIVLGVVEGLTEFLPISSTGHLIVAQDMLGFYDASKMFTVVIQMGAVAAVAWFYRVNLLNITKDLLQGDRKARKFWLIWILATIPVALFGLLFDAQIEAYAISMTVAIALIVGGILIWFIETFHETKPSKKEPLLNEITFSQAFKIGIYQVLALVPGVSRSGATIMGGVLSGLDRVTATAFSFYLGIPILLMAGVFKLFTGDLRSIEGGGLALIFGTIASFITALMVIGWLLRYVSKNNFKLFAYYRIAFGFFILLLIYLDVI